MLALAVVAGALVLEWLLPISVLPPAGLTSAVTWIGAAVAVAGFALEAAAGAALGRAGTDTRPYGTPTALVETGPFRWSRNPLYLGMLILVTGLAVAAGVEWGVLLLPLLWLGLDRMVIPAEERSLREAYPREWQAYAARVPRWIGMRAQ
jgi:protein-S-isoprenylcysteine O-methyltransferase Ste14